MFCCKIGLLWDVNAGWSWVRSTLEFQNLFAIGQVCPCECACLEGGGGGGGAYSQGLDAIL